MADLEDCIVDGGFALQIPCPDDDDACWDNALPDASAWNPRTVIGLNPDVKRIAQRFTAYDGQQHFQLTQFTYELSTGALEIHKNGLALFHSVDWAEQTSTKFSLLEPCEEGDVIIATGYTGISGEVHVDQTDTIINSYQQLRNYTDIETTMYARGKVVPIDGGGNWFQLHTGYMPGTFADDDENILVPTGGDGSAAWISRTAALSFDTLQTLKVHPALAIGDFVHTTGYRDEFDDGGNTYLIVAAATGANDGGTYIDLPGSGLQARGLFPGATYNSRQWGAVGDGVEDDTAPLQSALNSIAILGGGILVLNTTFENIYRCNLILQSNTNISGTTRGVSLVPAVDAPVIKLSQGSDVTQVVLEGITIDGTATQGSFTEQDGISIRPNLGVVHDTISVINCVIKNCGKRGLVALGKGPVGKVTQLSVQDTYITGSTDSGLFLQGLAEGISFDNCDISNNGDGTVALSNNVVIRYDPTDGLPKAIAFESCVFDTSSYATEGAAFAVDGALDIKLTSCIFTEFHYAIRLYGDIGTGVNGQFSVQGCSFDRDPTNGAIDALCRTDGVIGFVWEDNNVQADTIGPVGVEIDPNDAFTVQRVHIGPTCAWGSLTKAVNDFKEATVTAGEVDLIYGQREQPLIASGATNLNTINDRKGGTNQLVSGDSIHFTCADASAGVITVKHGTGNIHLAGGADFALSTDYSVLTLMWNSRVEAWVEVSRSANTA